MKSIITTTASCLVLALLTGCASVICGPTQKVSIDSRPRGADVLVYDSRGEVVLQSTTPCVAKLDRRAHDYLESASYVVLIRKDGYAPVQVPLTGIVNRAYFANILLGVVGLVVDPVTGSMWTLTPDTVSPKLLSENAAFFQRDNKGLLICLKEQVPQDLVQYLEPVTN
jgi:hypothetical protein